MQLFHLHLLHPAFQLCAVAERIVSGNSLLGISEHVESVNRGSSIQRYTLNRCNLVSTLDGSLAGDAPRSRRRSARSMIGMEEQRTEDTLLLRPSNRGHTSREQARHEAQPVTSSMECTLTLFISDIRISRQAAAAATLTTTSQVALVGKQEQRHSPIDKPIIR